MSQVCKEEAEFFLVCEYLFREVLICETQQRLIIVLQHLTDSHRLHFVFIYSWIFSKAKSNEKHVVINRNKVDFILNNVVLVN